MWNEFKSKDGRLLGFCKQDSGIFYFFGTRELPKDELPEVFPEFNFCFLKQVHGKEVIQADPSQMIEADGHWTNKKNQAVAIQTADCIPALIGSRNKVAAVHAGWRGVQKGILCVAGEVFEEPSHIYLGPHILKESFEVGIDVADDLQSCIKDENVLHPHEDSNKRRVNLTRIAESQVSQCFNIKELDSLAFDTFTDSRFASYRRLKGTKERQYSFVVLV